MAAQAMGFDVAELVLASVSRGLNAVKAGSDVNVLVGMVISYPIDYLMKQFKFFV